MIWSIFSSLSDTKEARRLASANVGRTDAGCANNWKENTVVSGRFTLLMFGMVVWELTLLKCTTMKLIHESISLLLLFLSNDFFFA